MRLSDKNKSKNESRTYLVRGLVTAKLMIMEILGCNVDVEERKRTEKDVLYAFMVGDKEVGTFLDPIENKDGRLTIY